MTEKKGRAKGRPVLFAAGILAVAAAVFFFIGRPGSGKGVRRDSGLNVLIITLDTTRADRLGCYGYEGARTPRIDALAAAGVLFEDAYCPTPLTLPSHASLFTGTDPYLHGVHNNGTYVLGPELATLAEILKSAGCETAAFTASFSVDSRFGLDRGFDVYDDTFQEGAPFKAINSERRAGEVFDAFRDWMEQRESGRFFAWVHFFDPHLPYDPPSPYREQFADDLYDGEIAYMDVHVGRIVDLLERQGLLHSTLLVLAGDHGEAFGEKGESGHGVFIYDGTMKIPLIFHAPENLPRGRTVRTRARLIDVFPTVLDLLGNPLRRKPSTAKVCCRASRGGGRRTDRFISKRSIPGKTTAGRN
jgi:arylsulfatase A-like enzyme